MKNVFLILVFVNLFAFNFFGQESLISKADSLRNLGRSFYDKNPARFISLLDSAAILYTQLENKKQQGYCLQNIAFAYEEKLDNVDSAISYIEKAIPIWIDIQESFNQANLLKYLGMFQWKKGKYTKGKENI